MINTRSPTRRPEGNDVQLIARADPALERPTCPDSYLQRDHPSIAVTLLNLPCDLTITLDQQTEQGKMVKTRFPFVASVQVFKETVCP